MLQKFKDISSAMFHHNDKILLAVSGGVDSMTMLDLFRRSDYRFAVAHCNFSLRGEESDGDTQFVIDYCEKNSIELHKIVFDTYAEMARSGNSLQMVARQLRYDWFNKIADQFEFTKIAIAHNSGDTIETFFINLIRGTGVRGMSGIAVCRDRIVRPLMSFSREEIERYAVEYEVAWRDDSSNSGTKYLRNKLRHIVIPQLREINADFDDVMLSNMGKVTEAVKFIDNIVAKVKEKSFSYYRGRTTIALSVVSDYQPFEFVLHELLYPFGFNATQIGAIVKNIEDSRHFECENYTAFLSRGLLILTPKDIFNEANDFIIDMYNEVHGFSFELLDIGDVETFNVGSDTAFFDADKVSLPFTVRAWREGDYFVPFGMTGRKKLSDYFVDSKINIADKGLEKLLVDGSGDILWLVGRRSDNRYRVSKNSKKVLKIRYNG